MRAWLAVSLGLLAGCASAGAGGSSAESTTRIVGGGGLSSSNVTLAASASASVATITAPLDRVWRIMPAVYDSVGIGLTTYDAAKRLVGNEGMKARQRLGTAMLSTYIDCGQAQIGPSADTYDVFLTVTTKVQSVSPTETRIATTVDAAAKPPNFGQDYSRCSSTGELEKRIAALVTSRLAVQ